MIDVESPVIPANIELPTKGPEALSDKVKALRLGTIDLLDEP